jgi:hypothetical protein
MTSLANVMGIGIWTESGPAKIEGYHITNEKGPEVSVSCQSLTAGTLTAKYSTGSDLYWPDFLFPTTPPVVTSSSLCGVTSAYTVQEGISTPVIEPDSSTLYWYVLVKVTSSTNGLKTAPRGDDVGAPPAIVSPSTGPPPAFQVQPFLLLVYTPYSSPVLS